MGTLRPMFHWPMVSKLRGILGDVFLWETPALDALAPDYALQRAAAIEYLDRKRPAEPTVITYKTSVLLPLSLIIIIVIVLAVMAKAMV